MITLCGIGNIFEGGRGEAKHLRVQWALEEVGLDNRFHALDQAAGDLDREDRWFGGVEHRLEGREWIACPEFTVADIAMASVA